MTGETSWIFGYGSLVWRPAFEYEERAAARVRGFARRFWQGSPDHRGVPQAPGRVVTLAAEPEAACGGLAYRVAHARREEVLAALDHRESGGFQRHRVELRFLDARRPPEPGLVYVAGPDNPNYLGPAPAAEIARQVAASAGASGSNREYVLRLDASLCELGLPDAHVSEIAALVRDGGYSPGRPRQEE